MVPEAPLSGEIVSGGTVIVKDAHATIDAGPLHPTALHMREVTTTRPWVLSGPERVDATEGGIAPLLSPTNAGPGLITLNGQFDGLTVSGSQQ